MCGREISSATCIGGVALALFLGAVGCGAASVVDRAGTERAILLVDCPQAAQVWVDGDAVGALARWGGALPLEPGFRRVTLTADGFLPARFEFDVGAGERYELAVELWPRIAEIDSE